MKRKAEYCSHVLFESVRSSFVGNFLRFLRQLNHLHRDIEIDLDNVREHLTNFGHETVNLRDKMINNICELLDIIIEQNYISNVTNIQNFKKLITIHLKCQKI